ncbi:MAG: hypothetical protein CVU44_02830 [Chloroflexi bacterium HGW-Chloroflexi-6]|nr:MAG: hypothetical protein CVU44_02830 [Chloroflexi bacterium HGW-Chloroflexi-6]
MSILGLGLTVLRKHIGLTVAMALAVGIPVMSFLALQAYQSGLRARFNVPYNDFLVVQLSGSFGEFYGSRLPASLQNELLAAGASKAIPEIHTITGTTQQDAILLRGIPLEDYERIETFKMLAGRPLQVGDPARLVMLGMRLAEEHGVLPGDTIAIRGRDFNVVGIFESQTYAGNEAWISLQDAQTLLGWGSDVSVYLIPAGETLQTGDTLPGGVLVVQQGDSGATLIAEWEPFFSLLYIVAAALGLAAAISLASILWRLAWLQRRELAILRSLGFGQASLTAYILTQGASITLLGTLLGWLGALAMGALTQIETAGISIQAALDARAVLSVLAFAAAITLAGSIVPIGWLTRFNLSALLRAE